MNIHSNMYYIILSIYYDFEYITNNISLKYKNEEPSYKYIDKSLNNLRMYLFPSPPNQQKTMTTTTKP